MQFPNGNRNIFRKNEKIIINVEWTKRQKINGTDTIII
jgi:hypothetical protein